jgi:hypothetical protein
MSRELAAIPEQARRQKQYGLEEGEERFDDDREKPKRQCDEPYERRKDRRKQRKGPAKYQQDEPGHEKSEDFHTALLSEDIEQGQRPNTSLA